MTTLQDMIDAGWTVHMRGPIKIGDAPFPEDWITDVQAATNDLVTHIVFLHRDSGNEKITFPITTTADLDLAKEQTRIENQVVGYQMRATCMATSLDGEILIPAIAENVRELTGWSIKVEEGGRQFHVHFEFEGESRNPGHLFLEDLGDVLTAISLKHRIEVSSKTISWGPYYKGQSLSFHAGDPISVLQPASQADLKGSAAMRQRPELKSITNELLTYYGETTVSSKIISGFSIFEDLAKSLPSSHILDPAEKLMVKKAIDVLTFKSDDEKKKKKLKEAIGRDALLYDKSRNERIATFFSEILQTDPSEIDKKIKLVSKVRGDLAHSTSDKVANIAEANKIIEEFILAYIDQLKKNPPTL